MTFGHIVNGNPRYKTAMPDEAGKKALMENRKAVNDIVYAVVGRLGGSISSEHGVGQQKRDAIKLRKSEVEMDLMQRVKDALDSQGIMNPGKFL